MIVLTGLIKLSMVVDVNKMVSSISLFFSFVISKYILSNLYYVFFDSINFLGFFIERDVFLFFIFFILILKSSISLEYFSFVLFGIPFNS